MDYIIWIDEAWRWAWAWPVIASALLFIKKDKNLIQTLDDSKKLSKQKREKLFNIIKSKSCKWEIIYEIWISSSKIIDKKWIKEANRLAMKKALDKLLTKIQIENIGKIQIDWNDNYKFKSIKIETEYIIKWDSKIDEIKAASIIAKVTRDKIMNNYCKKNKWYFFSEHVWYWTKKHRDALKKLWICNIHRKSYAPIKELI